MLVRNASSLKNSLESDIFPKISDNLEKNTKTIVYIYMSMLKWRNFEVLSFLPVRE